MPSAWLRPAMTSSRRKSTASRSADQSLPLEALKAALKVSKAPLLNKWRSMSATCGGITRQALHLVEHAQEDLQDGIAVVLGIGLGVDVEQDDIGLPGHGALHVAQEHGVFELALEEVERALGLAGTGLFGLHVGQQVRQDLDEVRLTRTEEAGHPHAHARGDGRVVGVLGGG